MNTKKGTNFSYLSNYPRLKTNPQHYKSYIQGILPHTADGSTNLYNAKRN
jgi:hypothetical protein